MDKLRNLATKGVKIFCPGSGSGSKKRITSGRVSSSSRYTRMPSPPVPLGTPFEEEIGVGAHDMDYVEAQENYGMKEENEIDAVNLDEDNENIAETPAVGDANVRSESVNLPFRPPSAPKPRNRTSIAWQFFQRISDIEAENRSKHRNDPITMKKLTNKAASKSKKSTSKASKKKFDDSNRPRLPKGMKYLIDKVPPHPLHMGSLCNCAFGEEIKEYFGENVLGAFRNRIFDIFLDFPRCNWIEQISKYQLILEIQQDNKDELHVWVHGKILIFTMLEFAIISGLKCIGNIDDYMYTSSSKSTLMSRYFPDNKRAITRSKLITRVQNGNFDNAEDALNLAIFFFVHTFMFSQHKEAPISVVHFQIVEDGRYIHFPWGKVTFEKLMSSWQQDFDTVKYLYSLSGMPHVLSVWIFECCSEVELKNVICQRNTIPRILNWSVQCIRPKYESFMSGMFTKHYYKNIQPTIDEVRSLDLSFSKDFEICDPKTYALTSDSGKLKRTVVEIQQRVGTITEEFGNFNTIPPREILIKAGFESFVSPDQPLKKRKTVMFEKEKQAVMDDDTSGSGHPVHHGSDLYRETNKDAADKGEIGVSEIQHHHHVEIDVSPQSHQYKYVPSSSRQPEGTSKSSLDGDEIKNYINKCHEDNDKESLNDMEVSRDEESNKQNLLEEQQLLDVNAANKDAGREDNFENEDCSDLQALEDELGKTITDSVQSTVDTILFGLSTPSTTKSLDVGASNKMTERHWDLPDNQIPPDFPDAQVRDLQASKEKAPAKRERKKSRVLRSTYILKYGSGSKDVVDIDKEEKLKYAFDGYNINQDLPNELMIDYSQWIAVGLLKTHYAKYTTTSCFFKTYVEKTHTRYYPAESAIDLSTQQDYPESIVEANNEDAIANIIKGFFMPAGLLWYMVVEVYFPINCGKEFHWVLAVIVLKERLIRVYDSLSSKRKKEPPIEIQKLAVMLPTYLSDNDFYDKTERTDWPSLEAYKGKITQQTGFVNEIPFEVDYVQNIPQ
ncbi:hypothetical protein BC332_27832 [Capsicum chinense]|nr:hypothetical protein BC332_27832 [Capsicum chinense]